jgi:hypothetical protein
MFISSPKRPEMFWLAIRRCGGPFEHENVCWGSKKFREFLDKLRNYISRTALLNGLPYPSILLLLLLH